MVMSKETPQTTKTNKQIKRIVVKVGTSSLTDETGSIQPQKMWALARGVQVLQNKLSCKVSVVSSGAGAVGRERLGLELPMTMPEKQATAAVGQALLMLDWARAFAPLPVAQLLLTASDIQERERYVNAKNALEASLKLNTIPIINENDSITTSEIKFGDNDTISAWVAYLMDADVLIILTDVDGLYTADPRKDKNAKRIKFVQDITEVEHLAGEAGSSRGTGGMVTKMTAAKIAAEAGIDTIIMSGGGEGLELLANSNLDASELGTHIVANNQRPARKAWIGQLNKKGTITIDEGAFQALKKGKSLLSSGIREITGNFVFGDAIEVLLEGKVVAKGMTNYSSDALTQIKGLNSNKIRDVLGYKDYDEAIHRDNLVLK